MTLKLNCPIFIVGTGRCGSTILNKLLAEHPDLSFLTTAAVIFPTNFALQKFILAIWDNPILGPLIRMRIIAGEAWPFWDHYIAGFSESFRDFYADDVTVSQKMMIQKHIPTLLTNKRHRLLVKFTGWTRIGFIKEVFPDAKIIHITRDPRAVVNSMLHIYFWKGRQGPNKLHTGLFSAEDMEILDRYNQSFIALAAIEYKRVLVAFHNSLELLTEETKKDVLDISYSSLCENQELQMCKVLNFCDLLHHPRFMKAISSYQLKNQNEKWRSNLTKQQQQKLENIILDLKLDRFNDY